MLNKSYVKDNNQNSSQHHLSSWISLIIAQYSPARFAIQSSKLLFLKTILNEKLNMSQGLGISTDKDEPR